MMNIAGYDILQEDVLKENDELEYTFQYSLLSLADQKTKAAPKALESHPNKSTTKTPIEHLVFKEEQYPSDHFGLFDAILGIISLVVLFILFW